MPLHIIDIGVIATCQGRPARWTAAGPVVTSVFLKFNWYNRQPKSTE